MRFFKKKTQSTAAQTCKESDVRILRCNGKDKYLLKEEEGKREKERGTTTGKRLRPVGSHCQVTC
jgi:hypothetical protein